MCWNRHVKIMNMNATQRSKIDHDDLPVGRGHPAGPRGPVSIVQLLTVAEPLPCVCRQTLNTSVGMLPKRLVSFALYYTCAPGKPQAYLPAC